LVSSAGYSWSISHPFYLVYWDYWLLLHLILEVHTILSWLLLVLVYKHVIDSLLVFVVMFLFCGFLVFLWYGYYLPSCSYWNSYIISCVRYYRLYTQSFTMLWWLLVSMSYWSLYMFIWCYLICFIVVSLIVVDLSYVYSLYHMLISIHCFLYGDYMSSYFHLIWSLISVSWCLLGYPTIIRLLVIICKQHWADVKD